MPTIKKKRQKEQRLESNKKQVDNITAHMGLLEVALIQVVAFQVENSLED